MTFTDYLVDSLLVLLVLRQVRESRFGRAATALPLVVVVAVARTYLKAIPTGSADLLLIAGLTLAGAAFGLISALATRLRRDAAGTVHVKAGPLAAGVWVLSMGSRFAFAVWASHGGGPSLYRFTVSHHLDVAVWTAALVLMALAEVVTRTGLLYLRSRQVPAPAASYGLAAG